MNGCDLMLVCSAQIAVLMGFACYARFARCRNAQLSPFARQVNASMDAGRKGLAALSTLRVCAAECRPPAGFAEQPVVSAVAGLSSGGLLNDLSWKYFSVKDT